MRSRGSVWYSRLALETNTATARDRGRSPSLAAFLSFLWPGLGQLYAGKRRLALIFAVPALLLIPVFAYQLRQGPATFVGRFADPSYALDALIVVLAIGAWRFAAVTHALVGADRRKTRRVVDRLVVVALAAVIILSHGFAGVLLATTYNADNRVFSQQNGLADLETPSPGLSAQPTSTDGSTATPAADARVTMLFTGLDSNPATRATHSYDSLMVVSFDPKSNSVQMVSLPREIASFPFYFHGVDSPADWITYLPTYVKNGAIQGSPDSPYITLVKEIQYLVGVHIDYWTVMNLQGFIKMIDAVGGVDVNNQSVINDGSYDWLDGTHGVYIGAGPQHLNGRYALAYARSRHGAGGNDYKRAGRQQEIMLALLHKMSQPGQIFQLSNIISQVGASVETGSTDPANPFKPSMVADYINAAENVPTGNFTNIVLGPPYTTSISSLIAGKASICLSMPKMAAESVTLFGQDSLWYGKHPVDTCP
jgi:LCP family protein required for cell wall assembly